MKASEKSLLILAIMSVALVAASQATIASFYHGVNSVRDTLVGASGFLLFCAGLAFVLAACGFCRHLLLKLFFSAFFVSNVFILVRPHMGGAWMPLWAIAAAGSAFVALFLCLFLRLGERGWKNIAKFVIVSACIFAFSPLLISSTARFGMAPSAATGTARFPVTNNMLIIILDETSPEYAQGLIAGLARAHLYTKSTEVTAAGHSTVNAIPSLFSSVRHDDVRPCNATALCGSTNFDFAALKARRSDTDIVGFWHPYCAILGLRSCVREESVFAQSSSVNFGLYGLWCSQFNRRRLFAFCDQGFPHVAVAAAARKVMAEKIQAAPFWEQGGTLLVHFPFPHPTMTFDFAALDVEYKLNVAQVEQLVAQLTAKMRARFGPDFAIVITSDHPLRTEMWCTSPQYNTPGCKESLPPDRGRVPFIIASPKPIDVAIAGSNVGLLLPLFAR